MSITHKEQSDLISYLTELSEHPDSLLHYITATTFTLWKEKKKEEKAVQIGSQSLNKK